MFSCLDLNLLIYFYLKMKTLFIGLAISICVVLILMYLVFKKYFRRYGSVSDVSMKVFKAYVGNVVDGDTVTVYHIPK
ncbi:hypothetical protein HERIO_2233 [Hepatospora eriocheir]|uniref:Uncharacterized protein n=1 Tax=Hepatospora eriocheir TaxID=1081669 RepID=A0A1X0Q7P6_9MICR|nr:hypothetical protein HERIO_2233 [Hepatospora eriocheir]